MRHEQMEDKLDNGVVYGNDAAAGSLLKEIETLMKRVDAAVGITRKWGAVTKWL